MSVCMQTAIYHEAGNQHTTVQKKVASVVLYRMRHQRMSCKQVISQHGQFTWWRRHGLAKPVLRNDAERAAWAQAGEIAASQIHPAWNYDSFRTCGRTLCFSKKLHYTAQTEPHAEKHPRMKRPATRYAARVKGSAIALWEKTKAFITASR